MTEKEQVEQNMREILQRYGVNVDNQIDNQLFSESIEDDVSLEQRVVVGITLGDLSENLVSYELYQQVSQMKEIYKMWIVESLSPLPLISISFKEDAKDSIQQLLNWLCVDSEKLRAIIGVGSVQYGIHGSDALMSYGSSGKLISNIIRGCVLLPRKSSWFNKLAISYMQFECGEAVEISGDSFYRVD